MEAATLALAIIGIVKETQNACYILQRKSLAEVPSLESLANIIILTERLRTFQPPFPELAQRPDVSDEVESLASSCAELVEEIRLVIRSAEPLKGGLWEPLQSIHRQRFLGSIRELDKIATFVALECRKQNKLRY